MDRIGSLANELSRDGYVLVAPPRLREALDLTEAELDALRPSWDALPRDAHLRDGGRYRYRRHGCFVQELAAEAALTRVPHRAHYQPTHYNALHGGIQRWFEPIADEVATQPAWSRLVTGLGTCFGRLKAAERWYIEAHQFRIDTTDGIGRPTPEGAHRDGVDFVAVILLRRSGVRGGETRVFELCGSTGFRFIIREPWTTLLLDDARVMHETTPILPDGDRGLRDTLVLTFRAGGFQSPES